LYDSIDNSNMFVKTCNHVDINIEQSDSPLAGYITSYYYGEINAFT